MFRTWALLLLALLAGCGKKPAPVVKPHGASMVTLPVAADPHVFAPPGGHYAELVLVGGVWHAFADERPSVVIKDQCEVTEFIKRYKESMEMQAVETVILVSLDKNAPAYHYGWVDVAAHSAGVSHLEFHVHSIKPPSGNAAIHSIEWNMVCPHCAISAEPIGLPHLTLVFVGDGVVQMKIGEVLLPMEGESVEDELSQLNQRLDEYARQVDAKAASRLIGVEMHSRTFSSQRYLNILQAVEAHGLLMSLWSLMEDDEQE